MAIKNGKTFIELIDQRRPEVWLRGSRVEGKLSEHPAFQGVMKTTAELYDLQHQADLIDKMTYTSPQTGERVGLSFLQPKTKEELVRKREMMTIWSNHHHGLLGRAPDYMNSALMAFYAAADLLEEHNPAYADNLRNYYAYCRENDITLSHAFVQPQASRMPELLDDGTFHSSAARVIERNADGIVVSGAFLLATQGVTCDEIWVHPPTTYMEEEDNDETFVFAVPNNLQGIKWICRESLVTGSSSFDYPLSSKYEEMDTLVIFDQVLVPWDRVFVLGSDHYSEALFSQTALHVHTAYQVLCRYIAKTELTLGVMQYMTETLNKTAHLDVMEKINDAIILLDSLKSLQLASEANAAIDRWGSMLPDRKKLWTANALFTKNYSKLLENMQLIGSSSLVMIPSEADFDSEIASYLGTYLKGFETEAKDKVQLFRMAWELSSSSFGARQSLYERFFFGDPGTVTRRLHYGYSDKEDYVKHVKAMLSESE